MERELRCKKCDRYLGKAHGTVVVELRCSSSCKEVSNFKIVNGDIDSDLRFKFVEKEPEVS